MLKAARGKVVFGMINEGSVRDLYLKGHPALEGRLLFVGVPPTHPAAAWLRVDDPVAHFSQIQELVKEGFLVRTRPDAYTVEARANDPHRLERALASGAQFISTDFPEADPAFSPYAAHLEGGRWCGSTRSTAIRPSAEWISRRVRRERKTVSVGSRESLSHAHFEGTMRAATSVSRSGRPGAASSSGLL